MLDIILFLMKLHLVLHYTTNKKIEFTTTVPQVELFLFRF